MSETIKIDTSGFSCPQPALMARQALQKAGKGVVEVKLDSNVACENVSRAANNLGWKVTPGQPSGDTCLLRIEK
jgi:tRNA 2-thiouridine synthesizing protein A